MLKAYPFAAVGFLVGAAIGFAWAQQTKKSIADNVSTDFSGGVITVRLDAAQSAKEGLYSLLGL